MLYCSVGTQIYPLYMCTFAYTFFCFFWIFLNREIIQYIVHFHCVHVCVHVVFLSINFCACLLSRAVKLNEMKQRDKEYSVSLQQASHSSRDNLL